jgi:hypothetical protein
MVGINDESRTGSSERLGCGLKFETVPLPPPFSTSGCGASRSGDTSCGNANFCGADQEQIVSVYITALWLYKWCLWKHFRRFGRKCVLRLVGGSRAYRLSLLARSSPMKTEAVCHSESSGYPWTAWRCSRSIGQSRAEHPSPPPDCPSLMGAV